jgi:7-carboxy-7-deazaguanine synthase
MRICQIVKTIQGEGSHAGRPCWLIRFAGCNLRCAYCDTPEALPMDAGREMALADVLKAMAGDPCRLALVTGGEPLAQQGACVALCAALLEAGFEVLIETNGSVDFRCLDPRVVKVVDVKTPASGAAGHNRLDLLDALSERDEIKFVLCDEADYQWACRLLAERGGCWRAAVLFGSTEALHPAEVARWILRDGLGVRLNVQLHKLLDLP